MKRALAGVLALMLVLAPIAPVALVGSAAAAPAGMAAIPDTSVTEDVPEGESIPLSANDLEGDVLASDHADSLAVVLTTTDRAPSVMDAESAVIDGDGMAIVLRDNRHSAGRDIAIDAGKLREALGYRPQAIHGTHEDGSEWTASAEYVDGYLVFDVPHFSSNTVTFSGEVEISMASATNDTSAQWSLSDYDAASDVTVNVTGVANSETDTISSTLTSGTINADIAGDKNPPSTTLTMEGSGFGSRTSTSSWSAVGDGHSATVDVAGSLSDDPTVANDATVTFFGNTNTNQETASGTAEDGSLSIGGNIVPTGHSTADPQLSITGSNVSLSVQEDETASTSAGDSPGHLGDIDWSMSIPSNYCCEQNGEVEYKIGSDGTWQTAASETLNGGGSSTSGTATVDVSVPDGKQVYLRASGSMPEISASTTFGPPGSVSVSTSTDSHSFGTISDGETASTQIGLSTGSETLDVSVEDGRVDWTLEYEERTATKNPSATINGQTVSHNGLLESGETATGSVDPSAFTSSTDVSLSLASAPSGSPSMTADYEIEINEVDGAFDPSVDIDQDGTPEVSHSGLLANGQAESTTIDPTLSDDSWSVSGLGSPVTVSADITETTVTQDPAVELNGTTTQLHSGTLAAGETVSTTIPKEHLREGSNSLTVSLGDGSHSADAPAMQADVTATHDASDRISVGYTATVFEESYNVSHTYADATTDAQVTIPFESSRVIGVKNVEYQIDGNGWQSVSAENYRFEGTTLDVYAGDAYGSEIPSGSTVDVRATGRKISVANGAVTVTDPTAPGESLDTQLQIDDRQPDFHVNVGPTDDGDRVHYAYSESFPTEDYAVIQAGGDQDLYLPNSKTGDTFRVSHLDTRVVAERGDVRVDVVKAGANPELDVSPGPGGAGDPVTIEYYNTESGVTYLLESLTRSIIVDSDIAQSPAIFEDDDSDETWTILKDSGGSSTDDGGGGPVGQFRETASNAAGFLPGAGFGQIALLAVLGLGGVIVLRRFWWPFGEPSNDFEEAATTTTTSIGDRLLSGLERGLGALGSLLAVLLSNRRASIAAGILAVIVAARVGVFSLPSGTGILIVVSGVPVATYLVLRRTNAVSQRVWIASTLVSVVLGLEFVAPGTVQTAIEQLTSENVAPLLILVAAGGLYAWYRLRQSDRPQIIFRGGEQ